MNKEKLTDFCAYFYASHYLPIALYDGDGNLIQRFCSNEDLPDFFSSVIIETLQIEKNPAIFSSAELGLYGIIRTSHGKNTILIGPTFNCSISPIILSHFIHRNHISWDAEHEVAQFLGGLPQYTYNQFLNLLGFIHLQLNDEKISPPEHFNVVDMVFDQAIAEQHADNYYEAKENQSSHGTYYFEKQMLDLVKSGDVEKLKTFLMKTLKTTELKEGKLADTPLRQAKNLFVGIVTMVGKTAAIGGGLGIEQTYQLIDVYIQECEKCPSVDAVKVLQYNMLIDFTTRVSQGKMPDNISREVYLAVQYIRTHTNSPIGVLDVVNYVKKSRAWLNQKFLSEMNETPGKYIMLCKLEEAKSLLAHSNKSLSEISNYFYFSSQSYFQNTFKKCYGITPNAYRKKHAK